MCLEQRVTPVAGTGTGVPTILTEGTALVTEYHLNYPSNPTSGSTHEIVDDPANDNSYWITGMSMDYVVITTVTPILLSTLQCPWEACHME